MFTTQDIRNEILDFVELQKKSGKRRQWKAVQGKEFETRLLVCNNFTKSFFCRHLRESDVFKGQQRFKSKEDECQM